MQGGVGRWEIKDWNVDELIGKNFLFFEAQESGTLPRDSRIEWRGDTYLDDKQAYERLDGGWFDAGGALFRLKAYTVLYTQVLHI